MRDSMVTVAALARAGAFSFAKIHVRGSEGLGNKIVYKYNFAIIKIAAGGFTVYNRDKPYSSGHTHMSSFNAAISAVKLVKRQQLPKNRSERFIESLKRLSTDQEYIEKLDEHCSIDYEAMMAHGEIDVGRCLGR